MKGRIYPDQPLVGVGAAVFNDNGEVLLIRRGKEPSAGLWALPGGLVELGEPLKTAAAREIREEANVEAKIGDVIDVLDLILKDEQGKVQYHYILVDYEAQYLDGSPQSSSDATDVGWFTPEQTNELDIPEATRLILNKVFSGR